MYVYDYELLEHNWTETVVAPTCTEAGYTLNECSCGNVYQSDAVSALGHNYTEVITAEQETFTCTRCGYSYSQAHTHDYVEIDRQEATCTQVGYVLLGCTTCGDRYQAITAPNANGHDYQETSRDAYWIYYTCTNCGATAKEAISSAPPVEVSLSLDESNSTMRDGCTEYLPIYAETTHDYIYASGKLMRETITTTVEGEVVETTVLDFIYDQNGKPYAMVHDDGETSTTYYYILNLQGDVVRIVSNDGTTIQDYKYNTWGEPTGSVDSVIGKVNPLRYRGYYYDSELEMYYLQSRYYDPSICRFINADGLASTGQGFVGYNMFAYCNNNPIPFADPTGYAIWGPTTVAICDGGVGNGSGTGPSAWKSYPYIPEEYDDSYFSEVEDALQAFDAAFAYLTNEDESVVLDADYFAFYKGALVIKLPNSNIGFSCGIIFIGNKIQSNQQGIQTVQHEYGHYAHLKQIGPVAYGSTVLIPSLAGYWGGVPYDKYFSQPWEYVAECLGGVNRVYSDNTPYTYSPHAAENALLYWIGTMFVGYASGG